MARSGKKTQNETGANVGYEAQLWQMPDALRGGIDATESKRAVHYLERAGVVGFVLANGSLSCNRSREGGMAHRTARVAVLSYPGSHNCAA